MGINNFLPLAIILIIIIAGLGLTREPLFANYLNKYIESYNRATVLSGVSMLNKLMIGLLYPVVGLLVNWSLNYSLIIIGSLIITIALLSKVKESYLID